MSERRNVRSFAVCVLLALLIPILAACGGTGTAPAASPAASSAVEPSAATSAAPSAAAPSSAAASASTAVEPSESSGASAPATGGAAPTPAESPINDKVIVVGSQQQPDTFFAIESSALATSEVLLPTGSTTGCITTLSYAYQNTYCFEELPTFENGGAVTKTVQIDPGAISPENPIEVGGALVTDTAIAEADGIEIPSQLDQLTLTWKLRTDLFWEDGQQVTSADVAEMYRVQKDPEVLLPTRQYIDRTISLETPDAQTAVQTMAPGYIESAYNVNPWLGFLAAHLYAGKSVAEIRNAEAAHPLSYGPFMLQEHEPGVQTTFVNNPYFARQPRVGTLIYKYITDSDQLLAQLETGEIDVPSAADLNLGQVPQLDQLEAQGKITTQYVAGTFWEHIDFGIERLDGEPSFFDDVRIRQAVAFAINRQEIVDNVQAGKTRVMNTIVPEDHPAYPGNDALEQYAYNPDRANQLLDEAGVTDSDGDGIREKDGRPMSMTFYTTEGRPDRQAAAEIIQQNLKQVGINIELEFVPGPEKLFLQGPEGILYARAFDLAMYGYLSGVQPGVSLYYCTEIPGPENSYAGQNTPGYCNPEYDRAGRAADRELDINKFKEAYREPLTIINRDLPTFPLYQRVKIGAFATGLTGIKIDPTMNQMSYNTEEWDINR